MDYKKLNNLIGWSVFAIATLVYFGTLEPTTSLWDCGEYITTAYKLEVGHPPGAPLFMMLGRLFTMFTSAENAALMINGMSALSSAFTILFLFWSITMIAKKIVLNPEVSLFKRGGDEDEDKPKEKKELTSGYIWAILGSGIIGGLAYAFTDSFWFSAVEGEVYAMSSFFTAIVVWAILKWDNEWQEKEDDPEGYTKNPDRWLIFIFFMIGLSIGVHLLNLLAIPAMAYVYYFRKVKKSTIGGFIVTGIIGLIVLVLVQNIIIPKTIQLASLVELGFVNDLGLPFNSGAIFLFMAISGLIVGGIMVTRKNTSSDTPMLLVYSALCLLSGMLNSSSLLFGFIIGLVLIGIFFVVYYAAEKNLEMAIVVSALGIVLGLIVWHMWMKKIDKDVLKRNIKVGMNKFFYSLAMLYVGYSCFAMIVIRSNADTPLDENNPENLVSLQAYLQREQYGDWPILYGQYFTAKANPREEWADLNDVYQRRYVVSTKSGQELKGFKTEGEATAYAATVNGDIEEKYYQTFSGKNSKPTFDSEHSTFFPRMYSSEDRHINGYQSWSGHKGARVPTMGENLTYFFNYQVDWMYWRYFMWNFSGRQSDEQGHGGPRDGNWISGLNFIDKHHIGDQTKAPAFITENPSNNKFYMLPLILGLIGFIFTLTKATKSWWIIFLLFLMTGLAIIIYLNQKPYEPRERDYAYAASFYAFAFYIGLSVLALFDAFKNMQWKELAYIVGITGGLGVVFAITDKTASLSMLYMTGVIAGLYSVFIALRSTLKKEAGAAILATLILLPVPGIMGSEGWDDHDRSDRYTARALAYNYLISCDDNAIVYTNGDNDTFPLWYLQEVEGIKTSVRVCNLSLLNTDWYTEQMTRKAYDSEALPISFTEEQYRQHGHLDYLYVFGTNELTMGSSTMSEKWKKITDKKIESNPELFANAFRTAVTSLKPILAQSKIPEMLPEFYNSFDSFDSTNTYYEFRNFVFKLVYDADEENGQQVSKYGLSENARQSAYNVLIQFNDAFDYLPADYAMAYLGDENNLEDKGVFILPSKGLTVNVDKEKVLANGIVSEEDADKVVDEIQWKLNKSTIYKADLMILDMVAHFDWDRPIYFASSASSTTYLGLQKYFYSEGLVYKLVPIDISQGRNPNSLGQINEPVYRSNLMEVFEWGNMDKEGILVDYYTRRLTNNYRVQFSVLADYYVEQIDKATQLVSMLEQVKAQDGPAEQVVKTPLGDFVRGEIDAEMAKAQSIIDSNSVKITSLLQKSFEVMPEANVPFGRVIPSYVQAFFAAGDEENGMMYADKMFGIFEEDIDYYLSVDPEFSLPMIQDFFDSYRGVFSLYQTVSVYSSDEAYQTTVGERFYNITMKVQAGLNPIRRTKPNGSARVNATFDSFFCTYKQLYNSLGLTNYDNSLCPDAIPGL
ncbi:MFS transporter [Paracrocinitomix mangrovi]|uniref:MFS transporter n=1 Tax=Paracrocinitomix mangrovi TaxID=2862509 RepID=UPI001C8D01BA|nr:MFS transporter [Paracrocinitomix mangrovi]UKN00472.1 MFS transporter [Paracrocinitomix mangrovi]